jgi:ABC-type nitrate/sulfonate/bicarbonate transport system ATPase subunit
VAFIEAARIAKSFPAGAASRPVLRGVSLSVERGEFVSIVGAMGSGKSTLLSILAGLTRADEGTVIVDGEPVQGVRADAAFVFQNYSLLPWFTALENVRLAVEASRPELTRAEQTARAKLTLEQVGLGNALNRRPRQLSGGMRQRVAIARAFATDPHLLFMDEPFGALDALTRATLQGELMRLSSSVSTPLTTIMITNSVEEALLLSDRIVPILPGPPATLGAPIAVDLPRGRTAAQLAHDQQASHVRAHVVATLTSALGSRPGAEALAEAAVRRATTRPEHTTPAVVLAEKEKTKPGLVFP